MNVIRSSLIAAMPNKLAIRPEMDATALRLGASMRNPSVTSGAYAIANALNGLARAEAAQLAGMDRPRLRATRSCATTPRGSPGCPTVPSPPVVAGRRVAGGVAAVDNATVSRSGHGATSPT